VMVAVMEQVEASSPTKNLTTTKPADLSPPAHIPRTPDVRNQAAGKRLPSSHQPSALITKICAGSHGSCAYSTVDQLDSQTPSGVLMLEFLSTVAVSSLDTENGRDNLHLGVTTAACCRTKLT
jgi:hypothetical protein